MLFVVTPNSRFPDIPNNLPLYLTSHFTKKCQFYSNLLKKFVYKTGILTKKKSALAFLESDPHFPWWTFVNVCGGDGWGGGDWLQWYGGSGGDDGSDVDGI